MNAKPLKKWGGQGFTREVGNIQPTLVANESMDQNVSDLRQSRRLVRG